MTQALGIAASAAMASSASAQSARPVDTRQAHYQIAVMERVLEGAVEHGATVIRDRLQALAPEAPAQMLILDNPRARGFRLDPYGVFFDVEVPSLNGSLTWSLRTLDQNDLGLQSALNVLRARLDPSDVDLQQALKRVELQVGPLAPAVTTGTAPVSAASRVPRLPNRARGASAASVGDQADQPVGASSVTPAPRPSPAPQAEDRILENPNEAYRDEVVQALADAMLDHSIALGIGQDEWLTIAARGIQDQPRLGPPDNDSQTVMIRLRGADLQAYRANQISRDEIIKRMDRRVF